MHKIGILDLRLVNLDRHLGNILVHNLDAGNGKKAAPPPPSSSSSSSSPPRNDERDEEDDEDGPRTADSRARHSTC